MGEGLILRTTCVRQNEMAHFPQNARHARAPSILIWTTMWTGRKNCSYNHGWFTVHLCVESLKISMIGGTRALRCFFDLDFLSHIHKDGELPASPPQLCLFGSNGS